MLDTSNTLRYTLTKFICIDLTYLFIVLVFKILINFQASIDDDLKDDLVSSMKLFTFPSPCVVFIFLRNVF